MQEYDESFFRAKANKRAGITWLALIFIATIYYGIKTKNGEIARGYFIAFTVVGWVTYITGYIVSMIKGKAAKEYKWVLGICYLLFYAVIAWTALDKISYIFILPLLSILILYKDPKFIKMIMWFTLFVLISSNIYKGVAKGMMDFVASEECALQFAIVLCCFACTNMAIRHLVESDGALTGSIESELAQVVQTVEQVENSNETLTANMNQVGEIMQIMTESINNAEQTTKTMLSKYEASAKSATDIESVVGELMEELGIGGFMNVSDIKSGMKFRMVIEDQTNAKEEYTGEVVDRKDNNVYININNRAAFDDKRRNLKCSFNAVVDNVLYCWNGIAIHNVKAGEKGQFKLTIDTNPQVYNRRKYPRMPLDNKCTISVDGTDITYYGHMVNISANGFAFSVNDSSFENMKGKNIVIEIDNFDVIKDKEIQGCIIRCSNDEGNYIVGCRMPEDSNEIKDYVNKNYSE